MCKARTILREAVKYHRSFVGKNELKEMAIKNPKLFNITKIAEEVLSHIGPYNFIDGKHCDYDDLSDCKTASIQPMPRPNGTSHLVEIAGLSSSSANRNQFKLGALRVMVYDPFIHDLHYFYIPRKDWIKMTRQNPCSISARITATYNSKKRIIKKLEPFRVNSLRALALAGG